jgi:AcrR family transcriptional regulator
MAASVISKQQVLAALAAARLTRRGRGQGQHGVDEDGLAGLSMDELAAAAGVSRATLYRLFGSQHALIAEAGLRPAPAVRGRILETALDLVGRQGLAELSMDELAAAAGVSRATVYRLFPGKAALFAELARAFSPFEPIAGVLDAGGDRPPAEVIPAVARAVASAMDGHMGLLLQLLFAYSRGSAASPPGSSHGTGADAVQRPGMRTLPLVTRYLAGRMAAGELRRMDPILAFQALVGPVVMHLLLRPAAGSMPGRGMRPELEEAVDEFAGAWLRAMAPGGRARPAPAASQPGKTHDAGPGTDTEQASRRGEVGGDGGAG